MLTHDEIRRFYDRFGSKLDRQVYEAAAFDILIEHGCFGEAMYIVEFGCGTGRLAVRLLKNILSDECRYTGVDISQTMTALCREKIEQYAGRAECCHTEGMPRVAVPDQCADRFVSTYVLDLLSRQDIDSVLDEAYRILLPGGLLCLASLTHGVSPLSRFVTKLWNALYRISPTAVGGCRPIKLAGYLPIGRWRILHDSVIVSYGVPSEVVVAEKFCC